MRPCQSATKLYSPINAKMLARHASRGGACVLQSQDIRSVAMLRITSDLHAQALTGAACATAQSYVGVDMVNHTISASLAE